MSCICLLTSIDALFPQRPVRRVAIIGSGIAGLTAAHALLRNDPSRPISSPMEVSIFDARTGLDREAGAGIQLNGALSVMGKINPSLQRAVLDAGQPIESIRSRSKPWQNETNKLFEPLLDLQLRDTIRN